MIALHAFLPRRQCASADKLDAKLATLVKYAVGKCLHRDWHSVGLRGTALDCHMLPSSDTRGISKLFIMQ